MDIDGSDSQTVTRLIDQEIEDLHATMPPYVLQVSNITGISPLLSPEGEETSTVHVEAVVKGPVGSPYALGAFKIDLLCDPHFPQTPPEVLVRSIMEHILVAETGTIADYFYDFCLPKYRTGSADYTLRGTLQAVVDLLNDPLADYKELYLSTRRVTSLWRSHPSGCRCDMFPVSFSELQGLDEEERSVLLQNLRDKYALAVSTHHAAKALRTEERLKAIHEYHCHRQHPDLFAGPKTEWFRPSFIEMINQISKCEQSELNQLSLEQKLAMCPAILEESPGIYSFDLLEPSFCVKLVEEMQNYEATAGLPKRRPNSMNNYGLVLNDIGLEQTVDRLLSAYLKQVARLLFPEWGGATLDHHHCFMVQYKPSEDLSLDMHIDDSEVTFNVNLIDEYEGSGLTFCGMFNSKNHRKLAIQYQHRLGRCVVHPGRHRHGADDIKAGVRQNLIVWGRSSVFRGQDENDLRRNLADEQTPDKMCLSRTHDPDYDVHAGK